MGNHEEFLLCSLDKKNMLPDSILQNERYEDVPVIWWRNGGDETWLSYVNDPNEYLVDGELNFRKLVKLFEDFKTSISKEHLDFFYSLEYIYIQKRIIFVHGGINKNIEFSKNTIKEFLWQRPPFGFKYETQRLVIHGHTPCNSVKLNTTENTLNIDTKCISDSGKLSVLFVDDNQTIEKIEEYK